MENINSFSREFQKIQKSLSEFIVSQDLKSNTIRRQLYSDLEILKIDILNYIDETESQIDSKEIIEKCHELLKSIDNETKKIPLVPIKRRGFMQNLRFFEYPLRFLGVASTFIIVGTFFSLPLIFLRALDEYFGSDPFEYYSEFIKRSISWCFLLQSGLTIEVQGLDKKDFEHPCVLLGFTHSSNLDGFLVSGICPIKQLAFGKKELFLVPFFSWISLAFGRIPVDRKHRERAIKALRRATQAAISDKSEENKVKNYTCIAIAPEGTRSTSGQLLPFKKGPFYMAEEMKSPILPMIIFGAYDLYPVGSWVNQTGHVIVRFLPSIHPDDAASKVQLLRMLRKQMLKELKKVPTNICKEVSWSRYIFSILMNIFSMLTLLAVIKSLNIVLIQHFKLSIPAIIFGSLLLSFAVTLTLFIYYVYIVDLLSKSKSD